MEWPAPPAAPLVSCGQVQASGGVRIMGIAIVGIDLGKNVCSIVEADEVGMVLRRRRVRRDKLVDHLSKLDPCVVAMEASCGAHHLAGQATSQGHEVRLMSPEYVRPYVKAQKNDERDAEAIVEAATRPTMRFVTPKSEDQLDIQALHRVRDRLVGQRTSLMDQIGLSGCCELIAERLSLSTLTNPGHADAEGFQDAPDVSLQVLAQMDQTLARANQAAEPISFFATDMDRSKPVGACELRQAFGIGSIRFIEPRRQALVRFAGINACGGQAKLRHPALQPDRKHPALMHDPVWRERSGAKPTCHAFRVRRTSPARDGLAIIIDNADRNFFQ